MEKKQEMRLREKASFYFNEKLICHVTKEPTGSINGWFRSDLIDELYYMFEDQKWPGQEIRLFLSDIFNINDWREKI